MDNLDDSENNVKISDSAYSNSYSNSNSQSRRSRSSKSTNSESNSSGSSGYGGKQSTSGSSNNIIQPLVKRAKGQDGTKNELAETETEAEFRLPQPAQPSKTKKEEQSDVTAVELHPPVEKGVQNMEPEETQPCEDTLTCHAQCPMQVVASRNIPLGGFSCVISMHDGIVMYTTSSLTNTIGFPKDMWIGRSFIDFIHPMDHSTFASQITKCVSIPKKDSSNKPVQVNDPVSTMFCRIRKYRGMAASFGVKERSVTFMPFTLKLTFKNGDEDNGMLIYLVIQATPLLSAFKSAHEILVKAVSFVMRHVSNGTLEHIDAEAVPFLGYFPQDVTGLDVLRLYHPEDLTYMRQIYETIMKEGTAPRSKPYRLMTQNGDYLKLETEWTSFVNPWSRKLEFVVGKHHVLQGPANPDVFQSPVVSSTREKRSAGEERNKVQSVRDSIVRIMNKVSCERGEVLTRPAEFAKQQMSKRCKDLATYMESLIKEPPKLSEQPEHVFEALNPASSCERDSEILGGISPHHDFHSDGKSSAETPLSYNQLNFNDNLQRFFDNHQELTYEEYQQAIVGHLEEIKYNNHYIGGRLSPMALYSTDSAEVTSSGESSSGPYVFKKQRETGSVRLTETLLNRHNTDMEKSLVKKHRDNRLATKEEREKTSYATILKKKEHLARCNASFVPTSANSGITDNQQSHGVKRPSKQVEQTSSRKHHCPAQRPPRRLHAGSPEPAGPGTAPSFLPPNLTEMISFVPNIGIPPHAQIMNHLPAGPGLMPLYYGDATSNTIPSTSAVTMVHSNATPIHYLMYGSAIVGSPVIISPFPVQPNVVQYASPHSTATTKVTSCNYAEVTETVLRPPHASSNRNRKHVVDEAKNEGESGLVNNEEGVDRTDGESSSSFYSSFFRTDSGSADDSDSKNTKVNDSTATTNNSKENVRAKPVRRKIEPPWMEQVCATPELIYKYQIPTKDAEEVLAADRKKLALLEQPSLVNDQLRQLYTDLQLEGVAERLTLEEGLTSSSSSGDEAMYSRESPAKVPKRTKKKREYTNLVMIYEEDAPMPPPQEDEAIPSTSLS